MKARRKRITSSNILHVSEIPATGKSSFCWYLTREYGFAHYDLECYPRGWPAPELISLWPSSPEDFVSELRRRYQNVVIDWGFPVHCTSIVNAFRDSGVQLIWFSGDIACARRLFVNRGGLDPQTFDIQVAQIAESRLPNGLEAIVVDALTKDGKVRPMKELYKGIFSSPCNERLTSRSTRGSK